MEGAVSAFVIAVFGTLMGASSALDILTSTRIIIPIITRILSTGLIWDTKCVRASRLHNASAFISGREFARVLLKAPTIYLALPLVCAHWAIVRGWAEPHYLTSYGLIPASVVVLYTPRDEGERAVCYALFAESYNCACKLVFTGSSQPS